MSLGRQGSKAQNNSKWKKVKNATKGGSNTPHNMDYVAKRMLSARRLKINELKNELEEVNTQVVELRSENKVLKKQLYLQDKQLVRYEGEQSDMPAIIQRHAEDVRSCKEQLRRQKERSQKMEKKYKNTQDELDRTKRLLRKMKDLVDDKELRERDDLSRRLSKLEPEVEEKDARVKVNIYDS